MEIPIDERGAIPSFVGLFDAAGSTPSLSISDVPLLFFLTTSTLSSSDNVSN